MKPGDKVKCINASFVNWLMLNHIYTVTEIVSPNYIKVAEDVYGFPWGVDRFEIISTIDYMAITRSCS